MTTKISTNNLDTSVTTLITQGGGPKIVSIAYPGNDTAADTAGGQTITLTGSGFNAGATVIVNGQAVGVVSVVSGTTITFTSPALAAGSYVIYVVNTDGGTAIAVPGIQYSGTPAWSTAAGTLGSYTETQAINNTVTATGDAPITYSLFSGNLPTGANFNANTGVISGTSPISSSPTTYTFTIRATDAQNQDTDRQFSLTINPDVVTWSSPADGTNYASDVNSPIANVSLSAAAASGQTVSYAANSLPIGLSLTAGVISGTPTTTGNVTTLLTATADVTNRTATRTINWVISVAADPNFEYVTTLLSANTPASTFVTDASTNAFAVTVFGDTRPSNFGPYTPGYYSNYFDGSGDYLSINYASGSTIAGDFTWECWAYDTGATSYGTLLGWRTGGAGWSGLLVNRNNSTNNLSVTINQSGITITQTSNTYVTNCWNHVALVRSGTTVTLYVNGTSAGTGTLSGSFNPGSSYWIGSDPFNNVSAAQLQGYVSNQRFVNGTAVYTSNFTPPTAPLTAIANTGLLTCQSNRLIDNSTNNFTVTRNGDVRVDSFDPFVPSSDFAGRGAGYFSATTAYGRVAMGGADSFGTGDFTVECWLYPSNSAINISLPSASTNSWAILTFGNQLYWQQSGGNLGDAGYGTVPLNTWTHLAVSRSGSTIRLFVNGAQVYSASNSFNYSGAPATRTIGPGEGGGIPAYISDFRVVKGTAVYTTTFTPPAAPLTAIANTSLLTLQNNQPNNNSMFLDSSTNNFNITRNGNTTQGSFSPYGGGWSNYFDGTGDYLTAPDNAAFDFGSGDFTIEAWVYPISVPSEQFVFAKRTSAGIYMPISLALKSSGGVNKLYLLGSTTGSSWNINSSFTTGSATIPVNTWTHIACVRNGTTISGYVNGVLDVSFTSISGSLMTNSSAISIGASSTAGETLFSGYLSNFRIVKGTAVYTSNFTPSTTPLTPIANTVLLTCADNRFIDDSANNFAITRNGDVRVERFNPFNPVVTTPTSYSAYFDGTGDTLTLASNAAFGFGTGNFTIELWVYCSFNSAIQEFIDARSSDTAQPWVFGINGTGLARTYDGTTIRTGGQLNANAWNHVAWVRANNVNTVYVNGVSGHTWTASQDFGSSKSLVIGNNVGPTNEPFTGYMSNLRIVKGTALYTSNFTPSTTPLTAVANTSLLTCQSATFVDNSINNFTITANGDTAPRQFNPFGWTSTTGTSAAYTPAVYGGSGYFDGSGDSLVINNPLHLGTDDFTIELWLYNRISYVGVGQGFINTETNGSGVTWSFAYHTYAGRNGFGFSYGVWGQYTVAKYVNGEWGKLNAWTHFAIQRRNGVIEIYVDGIRRSLTTHNENGTFSDSANLTSNFSSRTLFDGYNGMVSDFRITRGRAVYSSNFSLPLQPLPAAQNTTLLFNMTGAGIYDSSMMVNYETVGNSGISTSIKKYGTTSMYFDGSGDYLLAQSTPNIQFGSGSFTIEGWVYSNSISTPQVVLARRAALNAQGIVIVIDPSALFFAAGDSNTSAWEVSFTSSTLSSNTWYHFAFVRDGSSWRAFVNGVQIGTTTTWAGAIADETSTMVIGANSNFANGLNGYIDDLRITRGVARYTTTFTPTATPYIRN